MMDCSRQATADCSCACEKAPDRDRLAMRFARAKGVARSRQGERFATGGPLAPPGSLAWGGALRRVADGWVVPSREDEHRYVAVPGRYVPLGFARYVSPVVDQNDYTYYRVAGWRIAVPRTLPGERVRDLLHRIYYYGPQAAGYRRVGDSLIPAILGPGDRMTLSDSAVEYSPYPLTP